MPEGAGQWPGNRNIESSLVVVQRDTFLLLAVLALGPRLGVQWHMKPLPEEGANCPVATAHEEDFGTVGPVNSYRCHSNLELYFPSDILFLQSCQKLYPGFML